MNLSAHTLPTTTTLTHLTHPPTLLIGITYTPVHALSPSYGVHPHTAKSMPNLLDIGVEPADYNKAAAQEDLEE